MRTVAVAVELPMRADDALASTVENQILDGFADYASVNHTPNGAHTAYAVDFVFNPDALGVWVRLQEEGSLPGERRRLLRIAQAAFEFLVRPQAAYMSAHVYIEQTLPPFAGSTEAYTRQCVLALEDRLYRHTLTFLVERSAEEKPRLDIGIMWYEKVQDAALAAEVAARILSTVRRVVAEQQATLTMETNV